MRKRLNFKKIVNRLIWLITLGIFAHILFLLTTTEQSLLQQLNKIKLRFLLTISILMLVPWLGHAFRMMLWTRFLNVAMKYRDTLRVAVSTELGAALTPTIIGGGPIKLAMLLKHGIPAAKAGIILAIGALEDFIFYLTGILLAFFFARESISRIIVSIGSLITENLILVSSILAIVLGYTVLRLTGIIKWRLKFLGFLPLRYRYFTLKVLANIRSSIREIKNTIRLIFSQGKITFILSITVCFIQWASKFSILAILLLALGVDVELKFIYLKQWLIWLTMIFIPTPGATGGAEASFFLLFNKNIPGEVLNLTISVWRFFTYYYIMLSAVLIYQFTSFLALKKGKVPISSDG